MEFQATSIPGLIIIRPKRFADNRGYFMETYRKADFNAHIGDVEFVQDNESQSVRGVLRGLHLQTGNHAQAKLVRVTKGEVFDVAVDLRKGSPTYGQWHGERLSDLNGKIMFIPRGFAHGFLVMTDSAQFVYKTDNYYAPEAEKTIRYDDPQLHIEWPQLDIPYIVSERDTGKAISFAEFTDSL